MSEIQSMGRELNKLAKDFAVAVVVVNDMVSTSISTASVTSKLKFRYVMEVLYYTCFTQKGCLNKLGKKYYQ